MDSPGPCQPRFKIFERLLFDDFWVDWIDIDFEYTKIWSKYIPTSRTVKVPKRVRFWQENVHFSAAIHSSAFLSIIAAIVWEVCIFMPRSHTFGDFDFNGKPKGFDHYPIPIFDRLWLEGCICYPTSVQNSDIVLVNQIELLATMAILQSAEFSASLKNYWNLCQKSQTCL